MSILASYFLSPNERENAQNKKDQLTFPRPLEKEPHDKDLQASHGNHQATFDDTKIEDARLGALDGAKIAILARAEVFLVAADGRQLAVDFVDGLF